MGGSSPRDEIRERVGLIFMRIQEIALTLALTLTFL